MNLPAEHTDPFKTLYNGLWTVFDANPLISQLIREKNKTRWDTTIGMKDNIAAGDLPELIVMPISFSQEDMGTSGTGRISETFGVYFSTADKRIELIHALQWELYRCIETFNASVAGRLTYNNLRFIEIAKMGTGSTKDSPDFNRGIKGWFASWDITVGMFFPHNELIFDLEEEEENDGSSD